MLLLYPIYYKQFGIRRLNQLLTPNLSSINELPRNTLLHYLTDDKDDYDVDSSKIYFAGYNKRIQLDLVDTLIEPNSSNKRLNFIPRENLNPFLRANKNFKYLKGSVANNLDKNSLSVLNYNYIKKIYKYIDLPLTDYQKWKDLQNTLWSKVNEVSKTSDRNQFVFINIDDDLPGLSLLKFYASGMSISIARAFNTPTKRTILEFFRWLSEENREESVFSKLEDKNLHKVTIVFTNSSGKSIVLNMGLLNAWIKDHIGYNGEKVSMQLTHLNMQKLFIKTMMTLVSINDEIPVETIVQEIPTNDSTNVNTDTDNEEVEDTYDDPQDDSTDPADIQNELANSKPDTVKAIPNDTTVINHSKTETETTNDVINNFSDYEIDAVGFGDNFETQLSDLDEELKVLDDINERKLKNKGLVVNKTTGNIDEIPTISKEKTIEELNTIIYKDLSVEDTIKEQLDDLADTGMLTAADYKKANKEIEKYRTSKDPYGSGKLTIEVAKVTEQDINLTHEETTLELPPTVIDKSMARSTLEAFDKDYVNKVMKKDTLSMIQNIQKSGVVIGKHEVEIDNSALGCYENHTLELRPIDGQPSTIHIRVPKINEDGTYMANGNKYSMRKQRVDLPIRKINPYTVALTSYYGKTFVTIDQKKANNSSEWLIRQINLASIEDHTHIKNVTPGDVYDNNLKSPFMYGMLSNKYISFYAGDIYLFFNYGRRSELLKDSNILPELEKNDRILCGITKDKPVIMDKDSLLFIYDKGKLIPLGDIFKILNLSQIKVPVDFTQVRIFNKEIPVGILLGYYIGFNNLLKLLGVTYRTVEGKRNRNLEDDEYAIIFKDMSYVFKRSDKYSSLVLGGFVEFDKQIKQYDSDEFNTKNVYFNLLSISGLSSYYLKEIELTNQLFVDPITKGILEEMKEPTTFRGLILRSTEMLMKYSHPDSQDLSAMRIRGYERIPGVMYKELIASIRNFKSSNISGRSKIDMSPYKVWQTIAKDASVKIVEDINPIQNLKEAEIVTYVGEGGRGKESMNKASRAYHSTDIGVVSESTVDSSDVGINTYLAPGANFKNMRGIIKENKELEPTNILSTSALVSPFAVNDDMKRVNFIAIQQGHTIATEGYHQAHVRTGYEYEIPQRTTGLFSFAAEQDGIVKAITSKGIIFEYKDGTVKGTNLGRNFGKAEGSVYPHDIITNLKVNDKFKKGDIISYNTGFFEQDILDPTKIVLKSSMNVKVALWESNQTFEDSSAISRKLSNKLSTNKTKIKSYTVNFNQNIHDIVKVGSKVEANTVLLIIEDEITSTGGAFDEESLKVLRKLSNQAPTAKVIGTIDKIEVFYNGSKEDMSPSLKAIADKSDSEMRFECKSLNKEPINGRVTDEYRVDGVPLSLDKAEIKIYITSSIPAGVGDKGVFSSQLKSVFGEVMDYSMTTESGEEIEAVFGYRSIAARIVLSPILIGTTTTLLNVISKKAVDLYNK